MRRSRWRVKPGWAGTLPLAWALAWAGMFLGAAGCARSSTSIARPGSVTQWENRLFPEKAAGRSLASVPANPGRCFKDRLGGQTLRADVRQLESRIPAAAPGRGTWYGIDLRSLPSIQAQFLRDYGNWLFTQGADFKGCTGIPCVYNRIHGLVDDADSGWLAYGWYLRMGTALAAQNFLPGFYGSEDIAARTGEFQVQKDSSENKLTFPGKSHLDFLFSADQLELLYRVAWILPEAFQRMGGWETLHRVPIGTQNVLGGSASGGTACGLASHYVQGGRIFHGRILLDNTCLHNTDNPYSGAEQMRVTTHELAHSLDWWLGGGNRSYQAVSGQADWQSLSGWTKEEVSDPVNKRVISIRWKSDPKKEGFVWSYAGTNPTEDFAETLAQFRFRSEEAIRKSPQKSGYISQKVFHGRAFDETGLLRFYQEDAYRRVQAALPKLVQDCLGTTVREPAATKTKPPTLRKPNKPVKPVKPTPTPEPAPPPKTHLVLTLQVAEPVLFCLEQKLEEQIGIALDRLRFEEDEACDILARKDATVLAHLFEQFGPEISGLALEQQRLTGLNKALDELRGDLQANVDPREIYLYCRRQEAPEECYHQALDQVFEDRAKPLVDALGSSRQMEKELYLRNHSFELTGVEVAQFYRQVFSGITPLLQKQVRERWDGCIDAPDTVERGALLTRPFSGGDRYVSGGILNCINTSVTQDLEQILDAYAQQIQLPPPGPDAQDFIINFLLPDYLAAMRTRLSAAVQEEGRMLEARKAPIEEMLVSRLLAAPADWLFAGSKEKPDKKTATARCRHAAENELTEYLARLSPEQGISVRFTAIEDLRHRWAADACRKGVASPVVDRQLSKSLWDTFKEAF